MREFDEATITDAGLERVANTPDLRARRLSQALVRHLHAFIWEIEPKEAEWEWEIRRCIQAKLSRRCFTLKNGTSSRDCRARRR